MGSLSLVLRAMGVAGGLAAVMLLAMPGDSTVSPTATITARPVEVLPPVSASLTDSLAEDIILYNLFSPARSFPERRYTGGTQPTVGGQVAGDEPAPVSSGFIPLLIGTSVSGRSGESRALLQLDPVEPAARFYSVGEGAGGYRVVSIEPREVVLSGPSGRVVLRLPQEDNS